MDIIEKVQGPTPWVSPIVVVPKPSGGIRLYVDMRKANDAIVRERYPIPTVDEVLQDNWNFNWKLVKSLVVSQRSQAMLDVTVTRD